MRAARGTLNFPGGRGLELAQVGEKTAEMATVAATARRGGTRQAAHGGAAHTEAPTGW